MTRSFELKDRLEALLGGPVDLVMAGAMHNPSFVGSVNQSRQSLSAA